MLENGIVQNKNHVIVLNCYQVSIGSIVIEKRSIHAAMFIGLHFNKRGLDLHLLNLTINGLTLQADGQANPGCVSSPRNKTQVEEQIRGINSESDYSLHNTGNPGITFFVVGHTSHNRCNLSFQEFFMPAEQ